MFQLSTDTADSATIPIRDPACSPIKPFNTLLNVVKFLLYSDPLPENPVLIMAQRPVIIWVRCVSVRVRAWVGPAVPTCVQDCNSETCS